MKAFRIVVLLLVLCLQASCDSSSSTADSSEVAKSDEAATGAAGSSAGISDPGVLSPGNQSGDSSGLGADEEDISIEKLQSRLGLKVMTDAWTGDLDGMIKRRVIRVLTVYGLGRYFFEDAREQGVPVETMKAFEKTLNQGRPPHEHVHVVFIPVNRQQLIPALLEGRGDMIAAGLTITPERLEKVDFSVPISKPLQEILVTGPSAADLESLQDLAGKTVPVRESSSYRASLQALSSRLEDAGLDPIEIQPVSELLEDEDLLEMVSGGLLPWVVVDDYKANMFKDVFPDLVVRSDLVFREAGQIAYAFRKGSPEFANAINAHLQGYREGSLNGNILINRYLRDYKWVENALDSDDYGRFEALVDFFRKYGEQYGVDATLVAAQGYQESRLDQSMRSKAGAIGIMQLLPSTAADRNVGIPDISDAENNIHAGIKYLNFIRNTYFPDLANDRVNQTLLAMASYNAGPNRINGLRKKAAQQGLDPNRWFGNVEVVTAREVGREPVQYVANIYKYYTAYQLAAIQMDARRQKREELGVRQ